MSEVVLTWRHLVQLCCEDEDQAGWLLARHHRDSLHSNDCIGYYGSNGICLELPQTIEIVVAFSKWGNINERSREISITCQWPFPLALASSLHFLQSPETTLHGGLHLKPFRQQSNAEICRAYGISGTTHEPNHQPATNQGQDALPRWWERLTITK